MLPSRFEYHRPDSLEEALHLLAEYGDEAKVLAGGQSLIPVMKLRLAAPAAWSTSAGSAWTRSPRPTAASRSARSRATATSSDPTC